MTIWFAFKSNPIEWIREFKIGWRRRSKMILDNCGLPMWLINWRCPTPEYMRGNWGDILTALSDSLDPRSSLYVKNRDGANK